MRELRADTGAFGCVASWWEGRGEGRSEDECASFGAKSKPGTGLLEAGEGIAGVGCGSDTVLPKHEGRSGGGYR